MAFLGQLQGGTTLGNRLGSDLSQTLRGLAEGKIQQKKQHQQSQELQKIGFPKELASIFHTLDPKVQEGIWKQVSLQNIGNQQDQMQQGQMQQAQAPEQTQPTFTPDQTNFIKSLPSPLDRQKAAQQFQLQNQQQQPMQESPNQQIGESATQQQIASQLGNQQKPKSIFENTQDKLAQQQQLALYKDEIAKSKEQRKVEQADEKESKKWYREKITKSKDVKETNMRLDRMRKLVDKGNLTSPEFAVGLDTLAQGIWGVGINLKGFQNEDSQEFEKLSNDMLKGIQSVFGSRILKTEVDNFMKTIPTLLQSDAGKVAVIDNLKMLNEANLVEEKTAREIVKANDGKVPYNLQYLIDEQLGDYLDEIHDRFVNQSHDVPENAKPRSMKLDFVKKALKTGLTGSLL